MANLSPRVLLGNQSFSDGRAACWNQA